MTTPRDAKRNDDRARANAQAQNDQRRRIAHLAARLMAEDGIEDHGLAKKKAARQAGIADTCQLPGNDEIDEALRRYREIYHGEAHRETLSELRQIAVRVMSQFEAFNPHLVGAVLSGNAGRYADIKLQLFTDEAKAVEIFLLDYGIDYKAGQCSLYSGRTRITVPQFTFNDHGTGLDLTVLSMREARAPLKTSPDGKAIERAKLAEVKLLLAAQC